MGAERLIQEGALARTRPLAGRQVSAPSGAAAGILNLQRAVGNAATALIVQRELLEVSREDDPADAGAGGAGGAPPAPANGGTDGAGGAPPGAATASSDPGILSTIGTWVGNGLTTAANWVGDTFGFTGKTAGAAQANGNGVGADGSYTVNAPDNGGTVTGGFQGVAGTYTASNGDAVGGIGGSINTVNGQATVLGDPGGPRVDAFAGGPSASGGIVVNANKNGWNASAGAEAGVANGGVVIGDNDDSIKAGASIGPGVGVRAGVTTDPLGRPTYSGGVDIGPFTGDGKITPGKWGDNAYQNSSQPTNPTADDILGPPVF